MHTRSYLYHRHFIDIPLVDRRPIDPPPIVQLKIVGQDTTNMMDR